MSVIVIINPVSGACTPERARRRASEAAAVLEALGTGGRVHITQRPGHARELAAEGAQQGVRLVIAWGGDGTVNEVASALAFGATTLGIVPAGSGNGLARALGIARVPAQAIRDAVRVTPRIIDLGEFGGRLFVSVAGVGFDAHVAACFATEMSGRRRFSGYVRISARELVTYRPRHYRVTGHAGGPSRPILLVTIANGPEFGNGARIAPEARLDDGQLDLVVVEESSRLRTVCALPSLFTGGVARVKGVSIQRVSSASIEADEPMVFHVDGEPVFGGRRLDARVHPRALSVAAR